MTVINYALHHFLGKHTLRRSVLTNLILGFFIFILIAAVVQYLFKDLPNFVLLLAFFVFLIWGAGGTIACCIRIIRKPIDDYNSVYQRYLALMTILVFSVIVIAIVRDFFR